MKTDDRLWKGILENVFDDFLKFFFPESVDLFDLGKGFEFLDKELDQLFPVQESRAPKFVDKLVKVFTKHGREEWILVHVEVQGYHDKNFAKRMFTYFYRILDRYGKPVTAIAIFTDKDRKYHPRQYAYEFLGTKTTFQFNTYKILEQDEVSLAENDNPFALIVLTVLLSINSKKAGDENLFQLKYSLAKNLLERNFPKKKIDDLLVFLQRYVSFEDSVYNAKFDKAIEVLSNSQKTMGIKELVIELAKKDGKAAGLKAGLQEGIERGLEKGRNETKVEIVKNLLATNRFSIEEIANFASVDRKFVADVKELM
jgi:predicted transposase/invertase (TIGR01784 family)